MRLKLGVKCMSTGVNACSRTTLYAIYGVSLSMHRLAVRYSDKAVLRETQKCVIETAIPPTPYIPLDVGGLSYIWWHMITPTSEWV
jgi:hypothetical protein